MPLPFSIRSVNTQITLIISVYPKIIVYIFWVKVILHYMQKKKKKCQGKKKTKFPSQSCVLIVFVGIFQVIQEKKVKKEIKDGQELETQVNQDFQARIENFAKII